MLYKWKSGQHAWFSKEDAEKCCNGFRRILVIGSLIGVDRSGADPLPGGVPYGYKWEPT
jgi:hypothetical protein